MIQLPRVYPGPESVLYGGRVPGVLGLWLGINGGWPPLSTGNQPMRNMGGFQGPSGGFAGSADTGAMGVLGSARFGMAPSIQHTNVLDGTYLMSNASFVFPLGDTMTILLGYEKRDSTNRDSTAWGIEETVLATRGACYMPWSDGNIYFDWGGASNGSSRLTVSGQNFTGYHVWGQTVGPRGMECYRDGALVGSNAGTPSRTVTTTRFLLGNGSQGSVGSDLANYYWVMVSREQLPGALIAAISADPIGYLFQPLMMGDDFDTFDTGWFDRHQRTHGPGWFMA